MEEHRSSLFITHEGARDKDRFSAALNPKVKDSEERILFNAYRYTASQIYEVIGLGQSPDEEIFFVLGTRASQMSPHPRPEKFSQIITFVAGEGREMAFDEILKKVLAVYRPRLLATDQSALLDVAEIVGKLYSPFYQTTSPLPVLTTANITALYQKYGTTVPKDINMRSDWLTVVHLPQLRVTEDGTVIIEMWAGRDEHNTRYNPEYTNTVPLWRLTITMTEHDITVKPRQIQHCYEDTEIEKIGYGNFMNNINYKLFDTAFMSLAKRTFTGNEIGFTPGDDKFRKFFQMQLRRRKNMTPESIKFLLNNCCVTSLDLSDIHQKTHEAGNESASSDVSMLGIRTLSQNSPNKPCDQCLQCLTVAMTHASNLKELHVTNIIEHYDGKAVNTSITHLVISRSVTDLKFLDHFPNLESLALYSKYEAPKDVTPIERLTSLKHLNIQGTLIAKILNFELMSQLRSLNIIDAWAMNQPITIEGLEHIARSLPFLESINLTGSGLTSLHALGDMKHLTRVEMSKCLHGASLSALTNIKVLKLNEMHSQQQHFDALGRLTQLDVLELLPLQVISKQNVMRLTTNLKSLIAREYSTIETIQEVLPPKIEHLELATTNFNPIVSTLTNLKSLVLSINDPNMDINHFYETIAKLTQLESLELSPMTNDGLGKLTTLVNLKEINIRQQHHFDSHGAAHFKHFTKLRRVSFSSTPIADLALVYLTQLEHLEYLSLKRTCVSKEAIEFLEDHRAYLEIANDHYY